MGSGERVGRAVDLDVVQENSAILKSFRQRSKATLGLFAGTAVGITPQADRCSLHLVAAKDEMRRALLERFGQEVLHRPLEFTGELQQQVEGGRLGFMLDGGQLTRTDTEACRQIIDAQPPRASQERDLLRNGVRRRRLPAALVEERATRVAELIVFVVDRPRREYETLTISAGS